MDFSDRFGGLFFLDKENFSCYNVRAITGAAKGAVQGAQDGLISGMVMGGLSGAMNPSFCFVAGTAVLTTVGKKAIEAIQVGDTIPCVDHITGDASEKKVISTTVNKVNHGIATKSSYMIL